MPLPSQTSRSGSSGWNRTSGRAAGRTSPISKRIVGGSALLVLALVGTIGAWRWLGSGPAAKTELVNTGTSERTLASLRDPQQPTNAPLAPADPDPATLQPGATDPSSSTPAQQTPPAAGDPEPTQSPTLATPNRPIEPVRLLPTAEPAPSNGQPIGLAPGAATSVGTHIRLADEARAKDDLVLAREHYLRLLANDQARPEDRDLARREISALNDVILFSPRLFPGEPMSESYTVVGRDTLVGIKNKLGLVTHSELIARINKLAAANQIRVDQRLKVVRGPFHAEVDKSEYRMDIYTGDPENRAAWRYVRSFRVGLGEGDSTPIGVFTVRKGSKLKNPYWINPRTGEHFKADDPKNPIGERWIGLRGLGEFDDLKGYGIHGTIDQDSIGQQRSMGCIRMGDGEIEFAYELLEEDVSRVIVID